MSSVTIYPQRLGRHIYRTRPFPQPKVVRLWHRLLRWVRGLV